MAWYNNLPDMRGLIDNADVHSVAVAAVAKLRNSSVSASVVAIRAAPKTEL